MHIKNIKYLILSFCLCLIFTYKSHAFPYPEVQNEKIQQTGLTVESVEDWLITKKLSQDYNGQHFFNLLPDRLHIEKNDTIKFNPDFVRITSQTGGRFSKNVIKIEIKFSALDPHLSEDFKTLLIVKPLKNGPLEAMNLNTVKDAGKLKEVNKTTGLHIAFHDHIFTYTQENSDNNSTNGSKEHYFALLHPASGQSLASLIKTGEEATLHKAFSTLGQQIGTLHFEHMDLNTIALSLSDDIDILDLYKTLTIHGDSHWSNIFYDDRSDLITLIDNETFAYALDQPTSIALDLYCILLMPLIDYKVLNKINNEKQSFLLECYCIFITKYISSYPSEETDTLYLYIHTLLKNPVKLSLARLSGEITREPHSLTASESSFLNQILSSIALSKKAIINDTENIAPVN